MQTAFSYIEGLELAIVSWHKVSSPDLVWKRPGNAMFSLCARTRWGSWNLSRRPIKSRWTRLLAIYDTLLCKCFLTAQVQLRSWCRQRWRDHPESHPDWNTPLQQPTRMPKTHQMEGKSQSFGYEEEHCWWRTQVAASGMLYLCFLASFT